MPFCQTPALLGGTLHSSHAFPTIATGGDIVGQEANSETRVHGARVYEQPIDFDSYPSSYGIQRRSVVVKASSVISLRHVPYKKTAHFSVPSRT